MARVWVRIAIVVTVIATVGFAGYQIRLAARALDEEQTVERIYTDLSWALALTLADLRTAEQASVAAGQDWVYWNTKVTSYLNTVRGRLEDLRRLAVTPSSVDALDAAEAAVTDLQRMDQRVREHADRGESLLASNLIFTDGLELAAGAAANVELARASERATRNETMRAARSQQATMLAVGAGAGVLAMLLLAPVTRAKGHAPFASLDAVDRATPGDAASPSLDDLVIRSSLGATATARAAGAVDAAAASAASTAHERNETPSPDLSVAADLCTDLGTVADTKELPALMERAADVLNASTLVLWVRDSTGHALRPAIGHGFPAQSLASLGSIPTDGDNATSAAYRSARMQVVEHTDTASGGLAIPLRSVEGCVGVLAAELRDDWETSSAVQASAAIIAAQLATMVPTGSEGETEAGAVSD